MINVKGSEHLKVIVTTDIGLERFACIDIENIFMFSSINIFCISLENHGISVVLSPDPVDPFHIAKVIVSRHVRGYWAIPIQRVCKALYEDIVKASTELIFLLNVHRPVKIIGVCRKRGWYIDSCSSLLKYIGNFIESIDIAEVDFHNYEYILRIEIIQNIAGLTIYRKEDEKLFKIKKL